MDEPPPTSAIERDDCLDRLARAPLARILVSVRCLPTALPARIRLLNRERILLVTTDPVVLRAAQRHDVLTVQVDGVDERDRPWSVVASGIAEVSPPVVPGEDVLSETTGFAEQHVTFPISVVVGQQY